MSSLWNFGGEVLEDFGGFDNHDGPPLKQTVLAKARELLSQYPVKDQCQNSMKVTGLAIAIGAS